MSSPSSSHNYTQVIVVGAGPIGLITALKLAQHGVTCKLIERNVEATKWPKMDLMNSRTMELLRRMHLCKGAREIGKLFLKASLFLKNQLKGIGDV